ncbi:putative sporulation integral membrane protein [Gottschalkia acidurici 9a]|uniref:Sporulation integral membrane protein n=1 Tax=Gottschalkia acidurici (strain ATCC 7906 / DSM 604 / BCRC 14475 / CIP 104303 / KCTC 5404 / NCIMB 10678 / 9a) TaxID=1128398 RepID=K0B0R1_GOTA9|nr:sporulation integral membrane protein YlbJ [Gottschalkia acidurici]AFS78667.1 putative sporulation integral membrane protein [Gottschalkia acidurici 9a]
MTILTFIIILMFIILFSILLKNKSYIWNFIVIFLVLFLVISIIIYPKHSVDAALEGVQTWLFVVLPSLLPFFIGAELLTKLGLVDFIGILLEPIMYPLFRVPGKGSFVFAMSVTSGYPVGASLVSNLRSENSITKSEAQRLISFCSTSGPLFIIGAVSIGMLKNPLAGTLLSISHYLGAISVGILFRYLGEYDKFRKNNSNINYIKKSFNALLNLKNKDLSSFSLMMSDSIKSGFNSITMVGGFIIVYSVIIEILDVTNIMNYVSSLLISLTQLNIDSELVKSLLSGIIELTNGCKSISELNISLILKLCSVSFIIGWGGFSVHSQAISMMNKTDISSKLYLISKVLHGVLSSLYTYLIYTFFFKDKLNIISTTTSNITSSYPSNPLSTFKFALKLEATVVVTIIAISIVTGTLYTIKHYLSK